MEKSGPAVEGVMAAVSSVDTNAALMAGAEAAANAAAEVRAIIEMSQPVLKGVMIAVSSVDAHAALIAGAEAAANTAAEVRMS
ncbi:hypothetical protein IMZ48_43425 [Candidatus Bathyarchaeota archaeon]|nr:hypothetical protein [Candidatus Bathyarchaeota archaeon]